MPSWQRSPRRLAVAELRLQVQGDQHPARSGEKGLVVGEYLGLPLGRNGQQGLAAATVFTIPLSVVKICRQPGAAHLGALLDQPRHAGIGEADRKSVV